MTGRARKAPVWEPGLIPAPGDLLDWRDGRHFDRWQDLPCVLCTKPTPMRSHRSEPVHKTCAESWIATNPAKARQGRFASDVQPKHGKASIDHA
ncbi:hypothetical protein O1Q96_23750 [Streptomyces sp. Qhu-G9]|uniref:hypothetical protein n=1 Tax=Streptomyces sp. Qhu-G9 TaxID=3452799 RepID=UPI0022ABF6F5|nr:hypothetical protein [Streptomyces aurantiacus]WAU82491.1 hypothetical protein O1Q96_23750 [Streptomyces aurantiacus]